MTRRVLGVVAGLLLAVALAVPVSTAAAAPAAAIDTSDATVVPIQVTGPPADRFTMVVLGDGYTADETAKFRADVDRHLNTLWSIEPYRSYRSYFDVYAVEIPSPDSGISCDPDVTSPKKNTPLGAALWSGCRTDGIQRLLVVGKQDAAKAYAATATPDYDQILVLGNSDTYGGAGGTLATATGGNALSALISPHELGHSLGGLQDEYDYYQRGIGGGAYTGPEPDSVHLTTYTTDQMRALHTKWWRWLGAPSPAGGVIDRYEGGNYDTTGIWRPSRHSIMKSLGYQYDQPERERMTQRISQQTKLIASSTATTDPVARDQVLWVDTPYPVYQQLDVSWSVDGRTVRDTGNARELRLGPQHLKPGQTVTATVTDPTAFVRDPAIRATMTETRSWTVGSSRVSAAPSDPTFTAATATDAPVDATQVVSAVPSHPAATALPVTWRLDGRIARDGDRNHDAFALASQRPTAGTHTLTATVADPVSGAELTRTWTVDAAAPDTTAALSDPLVRFAKPGHPDHYVFAGEFSMKLTATDDATGYLEREFRLDHDGWSNYYGWPTDTDAPFRFTPTGTDVDGLVYGNLGSGGMSLSPFQPRTPGYGGTHTVEYRSVDSAGNIAAANQFDASVLPAAPACTTTVTGAHAGGLTVTDGVTCLDGAQVSGPVDVRPGASLVASHSSIAGPVTSDAAATVQLVSTTVAGPMRVSGTTGEVSVLDTKVRGPVELTGNGTAHPITVAGSTVLGTLACTGNAADPATLGIGNKVTGTRSGQCTRV